MSLIKCLVLRTAGSAFRNRPAVHTVPFCLPPIFGCRFYNQVMRSTLFFLPVLLSICLAAVLPAAAQTPPVDAKPATGAVAAPNPPTEKRVERIHIEDAGSRIDELRVGGETRTITVAPKGGMPAYDVEPATANRSPGTTERSGAGATGGTRTWKILGF
jgi:hypothetical protein